MKKQYLSVSDLGRRGVDALSTCGSSYSQSLHEGQVGGIGWRALASCPCPWKWQAGQLHPPHASLPWKCTLRVRVYLLSHNIRGVHGWGQGH
jgi:hypothetical protein